MKKLVIYTDHKYGNNRYVVDMETGNISYDKFPFSGQWKLTGFRHVRRTSQFISFKEIQNDPKVLEVMTWQFLNGSGQWRVCDLDHGTRREWGERVLGVHFSK